MRQWPAVSPAIEYISRHRSTHSHTCTAFTVFTHRETHKTRSWSSANTVTPAMAMAMDAHRNGGDDDDDDDSGSGWIYGWMVR